MPCCTASSVDHHQSETEAFPLQKPTDAVTINRLQIDNFYSNVSRTLPGSLIEYPSGNRFSAKDGSRSAPQECLWKCSDNNQQKKNRAIRSDPHLNHQNQLRLYHIHPIVQRRRATRIKTKPTVTHACTHPTQSTRSRLLFSSSKQRWRGTDSRGHSHPRAEAAAGASLRVALPRDRRRLLRPQEAEAAAEGRSGGRDGTPWRRRPSRRRPRRRRPPRGGEVGFCGWVWLGFWFRERERRGEMARARRGERGKTMGRFCYVHTVREVLARGAQRQWEYAGDTQQRWGGAHVMGLPVRRGGPTARLARGLDDPLLDFKAQ